MTKGNPLPIIFKFFLPLFLGNLFQQLYNMADTIIVGRFVGANALAAVGSTGTIMFLVLGFAQGLTTGFTILTSQCYGAGNEKRVKHSVANGIILSIIVVVLTTLLSTLTMKQILTIMNTPEAIYQDAYIYIMTICFGIVCSVFYNLFSAFLRAVGNSRIPLYFLILSAGLNVILDLVLIIAFKLGVFGAALATDISQGVSAIACFIYIRKSVPVLRPSRYDWHLERADTAHQLRVGLPMALQFAITASGTMIMQASINIYQETAVAAYTAAAKLNGLITQAFPAMGQSMATYCGQNYGKGDYSRIRKGVRMALIASTIVSIVALALGLILLKPTLGLFFAADADMTELLKWATPYIQIAVLFYIPLGYIFIFRNAMQGCGYGFLPMMGGVVEFFTRLIVAIVSMRLGSYILAVAGDPSAWFTAAVFTGIAYIFVMKKVKITLTKKT